MRSRIGRGRRTGNPLSDALSKMGVWPDAREGLRSVASAA
jgi:hypothetical protein